MVPSSYHLVVKEKSSEEVLVLGMERSCCMLLDAAYTQQLVKSQASSSFQPKKLHFAVRDPSKHITSLEVLKFQYKVSIPLENIKGVEESTNLQRPRKKYVELVTVDDFSFWFLGFPNYKRILRYLRQITSHDCLSD